MALPSTLITNIASFYNTGCDFITKNGKRCGKALIYRDKDNNRVDCTQYCRQHIGVWISNLIGDMQNTKFASFRIENRTYTLIIKGWWIQREYHNEGKTYDDVGYYDEDNIGLNQTATAEEIEDFINKSTEQMNRPSTTSLDIGLEGFVPYPRFPIEIEDTYKNLLVNFSHLDEIDRPFLFTREWDLLVHDDIRNEQTDQVEGFKISISIDLKMK